MRYVEDRYLYLPIHSHLTEDDVNTVVEEFNRNRHGLSSHAPGTTGEARVETYCQSSFVEDRLLVTLNLCKQSPELSRRFQIAAVLIAAAITLA